MAFRRHPAAFLKGQSGEGTATAATVNSTLGLADVLLMDVAEVPSQPRHVLVVDDEADIRDLLTIWLRDDPQCSAVSQAGDLDAALAQAEAHSPDAILLDFFLGHRVCAEILPDLRTTCPDAFIVVYTASRRAAEDADVVSLGADTIVQKGNTSVDDVVDLLLRGVSEARTQLVEQ